MPRYANGQWPESVLIIFNRGRTVHRLSNGGTLVEDWYQGLTPGTYAKHLALVALAARNNNGRKLRLSDGFSCYRPIYGQQIARTLYGTGAAKVGTSSHGGFWENRETLAMDYGNWSDVYQGDRARFYADCRAVGLTPGMIEPRRGYPDEPWHVIDLAPWAPAPAGFNATPFTAKTADPPKPRLQEVDMIVIESTGMLKGDGVTPGWKFVIAPGYIKNVPLAQGDRYAAQTAQSVQPCDDQWLKEALWTHGLAEVFPSGTNDELRNFLVSLTNGGFYVASWLRATAPSVALTDTDRDSIAERVRAGLALPTAAQIADAVNDDAAERMKDDD